MLRLVSPVLFAPLGVDLPLDAMLVLLQGLEPALELALLSDQLAFFPADRKQLAIALVARARPLFTVSIRPTDVLLTQFPKSGRVSRSQFRG